MKRDRECTADESSPPKVHKKDEEVEMVESYFVFEARRVVGEGYFGLIQHGTWTTPQEGAREVVIKSALKKKDKESMLPMLRKEVRVHMQLSLMSLFVPRLIAVAEDAMHVHLVMEYCCGGDLFSYVQRRRSVNVDQVVPWICELVVVLDQLHSNNIVHGDLKLENVPIDADGHVRLCDFGLAEFNVQGSTLQGSRGSALYISPEQMRGRAYGSKVDVWCFGLVVVQLLSMLVLRPYERGDPENINVTLFEEEKDVSSEAKELVARLLAVDSAKRPSMEEVKQHAFFKSVDWSEIEKRQGSGSAQTEDNEEDVFEEMFTSLPVHVITHEACSKVFMVERVMQKN